jgi:hypothetical protein
MDQNNSCSTSSTRQASVGGSFDDEDDEDRPESPSPYSDDCTDLHVFHNQADMVDHYHGPLSLFVLCKQFRSCALSVSDTECSAPLRDMLQNLCERAGVLEPFPPFGGQSVINLLPKQQANTVIGYFFQHVDCATDVFVKDNLLAHVERIYSQSTEPGDDVWAICFQAITVLVWGMEISAQAGNGLFGDFARSFLPSRAALVNSRLLTTPRLINVQTLILLVCTTPIRYRYSSQYPADHSYRASQHNNLTHLDGLSFSSPTLVGLQEPWGSTKHPSFPTKPVHMRR